MTTDVYALLAARRGEILAVAARYGVTNIRVFGSVARREAGPDSDLDLLVTFPRGTSLLDQIGFSQTSRISSGCASRSRRTGGSRTDPRDRDAGSGAAVRPDRDRLADILEAIEKIREMLPPTQEELGGLGSSCRSGSSTTSR